MRLTSRAHRTIALPLTEDQSADMIYPDDLPYSPRLPRRSQFDVCDEGSMGRGIRTKVAFERGTVIAEFAGQFTSQVLQHTLQVTPTSHVHDPHFIGLLSHSCAPNSLLDMQGMELLALCDIPAGTLLTVDYALTEDILFRQFPCDCGASNCRGWITGRREKVSAKGRRHLAKRQH